MRKKNVPVRVCPDFRRVMSEARETYGKQLGRKIRSDRELTQIWANNPFISGRLKKLEMGTKKKAGRRR